MKLPIHRLKVENVKAWIFFTLALIVVGLFGAGTICSRQADFFFPYQIPSSAPIYPGGSSWEAVSNTVFLQPFTYIGKGHQCFAFESWDHQYILKFPYHSRCLPPSYLYFFPALANTYRTYKISHCLKKLKQDAGSYILAFEQFKEETGLVYLHLNRTTHLHTKARLKDKRGKQHTIDLDRMEFILQKKAELVYPKIAQWIQEGDREQAKQGLSRLVNLLLLRYARGLDDPEQLLEGNFGFIGNRPIQIDIGRLKKMSSLDHQMLAKKHIEGLLSSLKDDLIKANYLELAPHLTHQEWHFD